MAGAHTFVQATGMDNLAYYGYDEGALGASSE
jgi:hypothetical protein